MELVDVRPVWSMSDSEKLAALDALHDESARRETYRLQLMASLDHSGYANTLGAADLPTLLSVRHRLSLAQVRADLKLATTLPKYEVVSAALPTPFDPDDPDDIDDTDGIAKHEPCAEAADVDTQQAPVWLHLGQAKAIVAALEPVAATGRVPVEDLRVAEEQMVEAARGLDPPGLHRLGKKVRDIVDTDGPEPAEDRAYDQETLQLRKTDHGVTFTGRLANENAELLNTLILENSKPHKTIDGRRDPRSKGKRQSDALATVLNAAAGAVTTGHGAIKPHITVTIDYNELTAALNNATGLLGGSGQGPCPPVRARTPRAVLRGAGAEPPANSTSSPHSTSAARHQGSATSFTATDSPRPQYEDSPATPASCPSSSDPTRDPWTSGSNNATSPRLCAWPSMPATKAASSAAHHPACATPTTSFTGPKADPPASKTSS
ncbi:hypothetical protein GCM10009744_09850 [Kribbella alba]|uniref:DUF222 domain-containing protein n=1 Tax=Kribbella alba TaxID=190197 RepID=A0ABP4R0N4_9ACTN